jgi:hypothetical protein
MDITIKLSPEQENKFFDILRGQSAIILTPDSPVVDMTENTEKKDVKIDSKNEESMKMLPQSQLQKKTPAERIMNRLIALSKESSPVPYSKLLQSLPYPTVALQARLLSLNSSGKIRLYLKNSNGNFEPIKSIERNTYVSLNKPQKASAKQEKKSPVPAPIPCKIFHEGQGMLRRFTSISAALRYLGVKATSSKEKLDGQLVNGWRFSFDEVVK